MMAPHLFRQVARVLGVGLVAALVLPRTGAAQAKACARTATGAFTPNGIVASGVTLGVCAPSPNWARVAPLAMTAGTSTANALANGTVSFTYFANYLYLGFTVAQDADLNVFDAVVVAVDRTGNGWDDGDFFIRVRPDTAGWGATNPRVSPSGGTACNGNTIVEYYRYSAGDGGFILDNTADTAITAKVAYDYETAVDGETNLWNLEIKLPTSAKMLNGHSYFGIATAAFKMGAYVFADLGANQSGQVGMVLRWPDGIGDRQISQWDLNTPALSAASLADVSVNDVCFDVNFAVALPLTSNSMTEVNRTGPTTFKAWYYFAGPGSAVTAGPNNGDVRIQVYAFTGTDWETLWTSSNHETIATYNEAHSSIFQMAIPGGNAPTDFCSDVYVQNWQRDDNTTDASNHVHVNYIPFATSEVTKTVSLPVDRIPGLAPGATTSLLLHISASNDLGNQVIGLGVPGGAPARSGLFLGAGLCCLGAASLARRRRWPSLVLVVVGTAGIIDGCRRPPPIGTQRWSLTNAKELGLTPVAGEPGWYRMPARQGEIKRAEFHFTGRPLPYKTMTDSLPMRADSSGRPVAVRIPVRQGQVVSVFALGTVDVDGPDGPLAPTNANGLIRKTADVGLAAAPAYPVGRGRYVPAENVGTLVGSFDGFKTSFVIGTNASFVAPRGAEQVSLAINGSTGDYRRAVGRYNVKWIVTDAPTVPTATSYAYDTPYDQPNFVFGWLVLATVNLRTFYEVPIKDAKTGQMQLGRAQLGEAHMSLYESH